MTAILLSDCTYKTLYAGMFKMMHITTPASAIVGDTIDLSSEFKTGIIMGCSIGATGGNVNLTATSVSTTITIPGNAATEARYITVIGY
jgi:hypothetical protein